jgi:putative flippase GtrA
VVVTETYSGTGTAGNHRTSVRRRPDWRRVLPGQRLRVRFSRFTVGSVVSTLLSQATLTGLYGLGMANATEAAVVAFVAGAIPNFLINWRWTWGRHGRPALVRELVPYLAVIIGGGVTATLLTTVTDRMMGPLVTDRAWHTVVLDVAYLSSYALLAVAKFALLDRILRDRPASKGSASKGSASKGSGSAPVEAA